MASKVDKVLPLVSAVAPAVAAGVALIVDELGKSEATDQERREAELRRKEAELKRKEVELKRKEAELERARRALAEHAALGATASRSPRPKLERYTTPAPPCPVPIWTQDDGELRLFVQERITYEWCMMFNAAPSSVRALVSRYRRSQYRRVARLSMLMGEELDAAGVPFYGIRYVAYGQGPCEQERRFLLMINGERPPRELAPNERRTREPPMSPELKRYRRNERRRRRRRARLVQLASKANLGRELAEADASVAAELAEADASAAAEVEAAELGGADLNQQLERQRALAAQLAELEALMGKLSADRSAKGS
jgi:hypothetical protein